MKISLAAVLLPGLLLMSCSSLSNPERPQPGPYDGGKFYSTSDGTALYFREFGSLEGYSSTIFLLSGITGINHNAESELINAIAGKETRVVVIHPRGTGYSEGTRGDISDFSLFISDHIEIIRQLKADSRKGSSFFLYGHSMSAALACELAARLDETDGVILVNPPYRMKHSEGMTPGIVEYIGYAFRFLFAPHSLAVNMAGDPEKIVNPAEKAEAAARAEDPLLVRYFSLYMMMESGRMMDRMAENAAKISSPLLLVYGTADSIVDRKGCDIVYQAWNSRDREFLEIPGGPHGRETALASAPDIGRWITCRLK